MASPDVKRTIEAVWRIESARLIGGLVRLVRDVDLAEDLVQEALVAALERWPSTGIPDNPGAWLMATAKNRAIDHLRRRGKHEPEVEFDENQFLHDPANPLQQLEEQELQNQLLRCIDALKPKQKATMVLRDIEGYSVEETAGILACTKNNVLCNLHLARENVRRKMQEWFEMK